MNRIANYMKELNVKNKTYRKTIFEFDLMYVFGDSCLKRCISFGTESNKSAFHYNYISYVYCNHTSISITGGMRLCIPNELYTRIVHHISLNRI